MEFRWIKAHAGHRGNGMADQQAKEVAKKKNIEECYLKIPKSVVIIELKEQSVKAWQREWVETTKGAIRKAFFPKREDRLKWRLNTTPNYTTIVTGHGNIKSYLYKYKIIDNLMCPCKKVTKQCNTPNSATHYICLPTARER